MAKVIKVPGIKKFKKGMCLRQNYMWPGEPTRTYHMKVTKPQYDGKGAYVNIYKVKSNGKTEKYNKKAFVWDFETQIGKVRNPKGSGRIVKTKCLISK